MLDEGFEFGGADGRRFRLVKKLGEGGMGAVFRARDQKLGRDVAIKVILPAIAADQRAVAMFQREAQALAQIHDPGVVAVHDFGAGDDGGHQFLYLVMELVEGQSLGSDHQVPPRSLVDAIRLVAELARRVHVIHAAGVIHRDLKPQNVMIRSNGAVTVIDFGLAKPFDTNTSASNVTGFRSPGYSPPEVLVFNARIDARSDVYSLGRTLLAVVHGRHPMDPAACTPPPALKDVVDRATHLDPVQRYRSAAELADALDRVLAGLARPRRRMAPALAIAGAGTLALAGVVLAVRGGSADGGSGVAGAAAPDPAAPPAVVDAAAGASVGTSAPVADLVTRQVPVAPRIEGEPLAGHRVAHVDVVPATVEVRGPRAAVNGLLQLETALVSVAGRWSSSQTQVAFDLPADVTSDVRSVSVTVTITAPMGWVIVPPADATVALGRDPDDGPQVYAFARGIPEPPRVPFEIEVEAHPELGLAGVEADELCGPGTRLPTEAEWEWAARSGAFAMHGQEWTDDEFRDYASGELVPVDGFVRLRAVRGVPRGAKPSTVPHHHAAYRESYCDRPGPHCNSWKRIAFRCVRRLPK